MPLKAIRFRPGVNRENTRYTVEMVGTTSSNFPTMAGWYVSEKVRFRSGTPEKIGGWYPVSAVPYIGTCRSLFVWSTLDGTGLTGVGTDVKFYVNRGSAYFDITPIRSTVTLGANPFRTYISSTTVRVTAATHGAYAGDYVTYSGATTVNGLNFNGSFKIATIIDTNTYTITASTNANNNGTGGGSAVVAAYQIHVGPAFQIPITGWGAGYYGDGTWGNGGISYESLRLWSQANFGENLIFCTRGGPIYYWTVSSGFNAAAVAVTGLAGASDVPIVANFIFVSDASRFVFAFGTNPLGSATKDPMLVRWSDQESLIMWTPAATNQAGDIRLSRGTQLITCVQNRQEIIVWSDTSVYSLQYVGTPAVWSSQIVGDNITVMGPNAAILAAGTSYWMGIDKFYQYSGTVKTLRCDLREYIFSDINLFQTQQVFAGAVESFNEVWWFYCSANSNSINRYVVYNYVEDIWYYGSMGRTAWLDSTIFHNPIAATYDNTLVYHEYGLDDNTTGTNNPIDAYIESAEFDVDDGQKFGFIRRILPDVSFKNSTNSAPQVTMTLIPMQNSGSGYNVPQSTGGSNIATVTRTATAPIEEFTGQVFIRLRGRQMIFKIEGNQVGLQWQLGTPRIDIQPDGARGNT